MSTILDALKKVERDRQPARGPLLDLPTPDAKRRRRRVSIGMIGACATLGFAAGVGIALWRNSAPVEIAAVTPPALDASAQPEVAARPAVPPPVASRPAIAPAPAQVAAAPVGAKPAAAGAAPTDAATDNPAAATDDAEPQQLASVRRPNANANAPIAAPNASGNAPAVAPNAPITNPKVDGRQGADEGSALEPSPFGRGRAGAADAAAAPQAPVPPPAAAPRDDDVAAVAPPPPDDTAEPEEPEERAAPPAAPEEKVIDTGRSPSGQPKVALSFLQWSADPERRFAFISIEGAPSQRVREGDVAGGLTVAAITPNGVRLKHDTTVFTITPRH